MTRKQQRDVSSAPVLKSTAIRETDRILRAVADKDVILTLIGESGVGKEILARRAHELSSRQRGPFVAINCAAIPEALFESELFGYERGAFTSANERTTGKIAAAEHGTLFLDEIGELSLAMQAKLLRFLENRRYMRLGGATKIEANVRLIFATLRPLDDEIVAGRFRTDLFYRIQGISLRVPPLRERKTDILPLVDQFIAELAARHDVRPPRIARAARAALLEHTWPGNVRELRNLIETLCLLHGGRRVTLAELPEGIRARAPHPPHETASSSTQITLDLNTGLDALLVQIVSAAVTLDGGSKALAAERLRISLRTIQRYAASGRLHRGASSSLLNHPSDRSEASLRAADLSRRPPA